MAPWRRSLSLLTALLAVGACTQREPPVVRPRPVVVESPQPVSENGGGEVLPGAIHARVEADLSFRISGKIAARRNTKRLQLSRRIQLRRCLAFA